MIFSIGHSVLSTEQFLKMLQAHEIATLVDVRSRPFSSFNSQHNRPDLKRALEASGIRFVWEGRALGGLGNVSIRSDAFVEAMERVLQLQETGPVVLMCSEADPADCHRSQKLLAWSTYPTPPGEGFDGPRPDSRPHRWPYV